MQMKHKDDDNDTCTLLCKCIRKAPDNINVYSDGSWMTPTKRFLSLGGAGIWWPGRTLNRENDDNDLYYMPLSDAEYEIAFHKQEADGLTLYTKMGGYSGSSTRTELGAGIVAMAAHGPIHLASDSQAFVKAANALIKKFKKNKDNKIKWKMRNVEIYGNASIYL